MAHPSKSDLLEQALDLPVDERADLARDLIASLDAPPDGDVEEAWAREVERRLQAVDAGTTTVEDWSTVHDRILGRLRAMPR